MVKIYVKRILKKQMTLEEVPALWYEQVKQYLENNK